MAIRNENNRIRMNNFNKWGEKWGKGKYVLFKKMFENNYRYASNRRNQSRMNNFLWKTLYVAIMITGLAVVLVMGIRWYWQEKTESFDFILKICSFVIVVTVLALAIISRGLAIYKYQETWVRHSRQQYLMDREILLFLEEISPYNDSKKKERFIQNCIAIWDENFEKFGYNMETKEEKLINGEDFAAKIIK